MARAAQHPDPVARLARDAGQRPRGELGRDDQPVPPVPGPVPGHEGVHGDHEHPVPGRGGPVDQFLGQPAVAQDVQLEPQIGLLRLRRPPRWWWSPSWTACRAGRAAAPRAPRRSRRPGASSACTRSGPGPAAAAPPSRGTPRRCPFRHVHQRARLEPPAPERPGVSPHRQLFVGAAVDVVEDRARGQPAPRGAQVSDVMAGGKPPARGVELDRFHLDQLANLRCPHVRDDSRGAPGQGTRSRPRPGSAMIMKG